MPFSIIRNDITKVKADVVEAIGCSGEEDLDGNN